MGVRGGDNSGVTSGGEGSSAPGGRQPLVGADNLAAG